ncbi:MAG: aminotransferase class III-fold pyridoxal phosphate-dependent enzyme, partial [Myxococcales bacterium]|nr:aminotransferase class III-fold pyridoxal phosphate-dependent enzyme [Myxococcales bacterium]
EAKAALGEKLAAISPGDIDTFFLCLSGSEANENALKIARMITGRTKVIARRRSYHGASMGALSLTGDRRRTALEPGLWGVLRIEDPYCYRCPYGLEPGSCARQCATHLEHVLEMEDPSTVAAVFIEGVTGGNGGFVPPPDYWPTLRRICDEHGILLISDEVFSGFGRTGRWFAVDHWGVVPDLITMAKGVTSGYAAMGVVGMRPHIAAHFQDQKLWAGLTSYAHPMACAVASEAIDVYRDEGLIEAAAALEPVLLAGLEALKAKHPLIGDVRALGLLGSVEFVLDRATRAPAVPYGGPAPADSPLARLPAALRARRLHCAVRDNLLFVTPPLCISAADLQHGLALIDDALSEVTA